ncbi:MAG: NUDIX hydrolase [Betaproteobacteria bacterium]|nr:MAG: NUDIX hydrolase [Betaproteobacteria bacterium]
MDKSPSARPAVTVAAIVERDGRYLLVREETDHGLRLNQPAGHLEPGESLADGAAREALEETAWRVEPFALVGIYRWEAPDNGETFVRFAFAARALAEVRGRALDEGIVDSLWLGYEEIAARRAEHRSPLVLRCIHDYRAGRRWPVDIVQDVGGTPGEARR